jgi:hypothetical protein
MLCSTFFCPLCCAVSSLFIRYFVLLSALFAWYIASCTPFLSGILSCMKILCPVFRTVWCLFSRYVVLCKAVLSGMLCCTIPFFVRYIVLCQAFSSGILCCSVPFLPDILRRVHRFCPVYCAVYSVTDCSEVSSTLPTIVFPSGPLWPVPTNTLARFASEVHHYEHSCEQYG